MIRYRRLFQVREWAAIAVAVAAAIVACAQPAVATEATGRTVALRTYHSIDGETFPSASFTGIVLNGRYVVTSQWALEQGHANPFAGYEGRLARIQGVMRHEQSLVTFELDVSQTPRRVSDELALLEIDRADRESVGELVRYLPQLDTLEEATAGRLLGVPAPLAVEELSTRTIPPPLELTITWEHPLRRRATLAVPAEPTYPPQMVGAGVWNHQQELMGVLVRQDREWWIVDASVVRELGELGGVNWTERADFAEFGGADLRRPDPRPRAELRAIYELLDRNGLQMQLDRNLVDAVGQPQADQIMAMIAGGAYDHALNLLNRIEPLVTGRLMEKMDYRRALTLTLKGRPDDALRGLGQVEQMGHELTRARARLLRDVLEAHAAGELEGVDITTPDGLADGCLMTLGRMERDLAEELEEVQWRIGTAPVETVLIELEHVAEQVREYRLAWPRYFAPMLERIEQMRDRLVPTANR